MDVSLLTISSTAGQWAPHYLRTKKKGQQAKTNKHILWVREVIVDLLVKDVKDHIEEIPACDSNKFVIYYQSSDALINIFEKNEMVFGSMLTT